MRKSRLTWIVVLLAWYRFGAPTLAEDTSDRLASALSLLRQGDYATAQAAYEKLAGELTAADRIAAEAGLSEVNMAIGAYDAARVVLTAAVERSPDQEDLWGRLAELQFLTGDWESAQRSADKAVLLGADALRARLVLAHLHRESGRLKEALEGYRWFVRYYNRAQPRDAESLRLVAAGSLEYARWKGVSSVFHFVIGTLCPDALKDDPLDWQAAVLSGEVLLEKYNEPQATPEFEAALKINPLAAEAHLGLARAAHLRHEVEAAREFAVKALEINPHLQGGLLLMAELELEVDDHQAADIYIRAALEVNPRRQEALACQAIVAMQRDGLPSRESLQGLLAKIPRGEIQAQSAVNDFERITLLVAARNPKPGVYLNRLGEFFNDRKKYDLAEQCFQAAIDLMPQLAAARTNLGMLDMRLGKVADAESILNAAFKSDPFHVRVSNMRKVIGVLNGYETLRTEHFVVRVDKSQRMLGEYMADYLEELYTELTATYGYEPSAPTQFEVYSSTQGQTGHQWFSTRMVGLPWIQTVGASTGMMVAMASPQSVDEPFNWGRLVRHEFVHILTLQQTDFNIPHWLTEALAVRTEGMVLPEQWKGLLTRRVNAGDVYNLSTLIDGFQHPEGPSDWNMAYCQSRHYVRMIEQQWGADALTQLVDCYRRNLTTEQAIASITQLTLPEFEARYTDYLNNLVKEIESGEIAPEMDLEVARKLSEDDPGEASLRGRFAYALWKSGDEFAAREQAERTYDFDSGEPMATVVLLALADKDGETELADALIKEAHHPDNPNAVLLAFLAERSFNAGQLAEAEQYYRLGVEKFPWELKFLQGLAVSLVSLDQNDKALPVLVEVAQRDPDNLTVRSHLAQEFLNRKRFDEARNWAREILFVDVENPTAHLLLGRCWLAREDWIRGREEFERVLESDPDDIDATVGLARCDQHDGHLPAARERLDAVLKTNPEHEVAKQLRKELQ
ncbi:MAG: tetratricopeptide repeat protein [Planctomycetaceae bacterium]